MIHPAIWRQILAFGIGVDRHLGNLASTNRRNEVDGHGPTALCEQLLGARRNVDVHDEPSRVVRSANPSNRTGLPTRRGLRNDADEIT